MKYVSLGDYPSHADENVSCLECNCKARRVISRTSAWVDIQKYLLLRRWF